jgi:hypothetical protein
VKEVQALRVRQLLRLWVVAQIDQEAGREQGLVVIVRGQEGMFVLVSLVDYASN